MVTSVQKRDWEALRLSYGDYWYNLRNRLHVKDDCLLLDERIIILQQLRQTILNSLHMTNSGAAATLDWSGNIWFPHIHRTFVQMAQNCRHCTEQDQKNLMYPPPIRNHAQS